MKKMMKRLLPLLLVLCMALSSCQIGNITIEFVDDDTPPSTSHNGGTTPNSDPDEGDEEDGDGDEDDNNGYQTDFGGSDTVSFSLDDVPEFTDQAYVVINNNFPEFDEKDLTSTTAFEYYSELDDLGRCGMTYANVCLETMPTEQRGSISSVKPTGWKSVTYDIVDGKHLYNRCHLIGHQLTGENANKQNLITGTRYLNVVGMLPFEDLVADYVKETENHVLYRVTPFFVGDELVARGLQMEGWSVEDEGDGVCFNIYCYNNQPGITIDYATGDSWLNEDASAGEQKEYVLNTSGHKFHLPTCNSATSMKQSNRQDYKGSRELLIAQGYIPCGTCQP